jgi:hypothetical protein
MRGAALALCVAVQWMPSTLEGQSASDAVQGAWRVIQVVSTGPGGRTIEAPQPGLLLFAGGYYSYTFVTSEEPRPGLPAGPATAELLATVWNPFTANAGTFEVSGSTMTRRPIVAKSPESMAPGVFNEYSFRLSADTLWTTTTRTEVGAVRNPTTVRYIRAG